MAAIVIPMLRQFFYLQWVLVFANVFSNTCAIILMHLSP
jgi:hypothetical protein